MPGAQATGRHCSHTIPPSQSLSPSNAIAIMQTLSSNPSTIEVSYIVEFCSHACVMQLPTCQQLPTERGAHLSFVQSAATAHTHAHTQTLKKKVAPDFAELYVAEL